MTQRLVDQVDDHFGRNHGVYGSALSDMALMMKAMGNHQESTEIYLKALEVGAACYLAHAAWPRFIWVLRQ